ncbi:MAG: glycosyltransferase family 2 protein [Chitinophagaceae bacterium]|nr:glycosyltransferase family 2 protein [Chitinophagaceae bacterium]
MMISGFTIIRNAVKNDYPIVEAITSILPVVDEMVVLVGASDDATEELIRSIASPKIKIHHSVWNTQLQTGGVVLAEETNKAFALIDPASTWAFYIQADEVVHEKYHVAILEGCRTYKDDERVQGLLFEYLHFYGTYRYVGDSRRWYSHEVRIIKNDKRISAYRDAQGFRIGDKRLNVKRIDAWVYHYGWVKSQEKMIAKMKDVSNYWIADKEEWERFMAQENMFSFEDYDSIRRFTGTHPKVMQHRIQQQDYDLQLDVNKKKLKLKHRIMYFIEKLTGKRFFEFKNYRVI